MVLFCLLCYSIIVYFVKVKQCSIVIGWYQLLPSWGRLFLSLQMVNSNKEVYAQIALAMNRAFFRNNWVLYSSHTCLLLMLSVAKTNWSEPSLHTLIHPLYLYLSHNRAEAISDWTATANLSFWLVISRGLVMVCQLVWLSMYLKSTQKHQLRLRIIKFRLANILIYVTRSCNKSNHPLWKSKYNENEKNSKCLFFTFFN